jgi:zinc transporter
MTVENFRRTGETIYGSDSSGLIFGYIFADDADTRALDSVQAIEWLMASRTTDAAEFIWLHFSLSNANTEKWLSEHFVLPHEFFETIRESTGSTRIEQADNCLVVTINDVAYDFTNDASQIATMYMCIFRDVVISVRRHPLRSVDRLRGSVRAGERFASPVFLLAHLLRDQADVLQQIERDAAEQANRIEDNLLQGKVNAKRGNLGAMRRILIRLQRLLAPEPGALFRLLNRPPAWFKSDDTRELSAASEEFSTVLSDLSGLQERAKLLQEEITSHVAEQTNRSVFLLTVATVAALPINIIAGLFGMNVGGVPLSGNAHGFLIIAAITASVTVVVGWLALFRRRGS